MFCLCLRLLLCLSVSGCLCICLCRCPCVYLTALLSVPLSLRLSLCTQRPHREMARTMFYPPPSCVFTGLCGFPPFRRAVVILNALAVIVGRSQTFSVQASFETGNPPERVPIRSQNGAATPAGGPVETSWTPVGCLWSLWGCLGLLRGSLGEVPGHPEGALESVSRCSEDTSGDLFRAQRRKHSFLENRAPAYTGAWILRSGGLQNEAGIGSGRLPWAAMTRARHPAPSRNPTEPSGPLPGRLGRPVLQCHGPLPDRRPQGPLSSMV